MFVTIYYGSKYHTSENVNKSSTVKKQRKFSRKYESLRRRNKNIKEGKVTRQNIQK